MIYHVLIEYHLHVLLSELRLLTESGSDSSELLFELVMINIELRDDSYLQEVIC